MLTTIVSLRKGKMRHLDLFSGIGGFALAAQTVWRDEYECVGFCDNNYFCQQVLSKNFPGVPIYDDIRTLTNTQSTGQCAKQKTNRSDATRQEFMECSEEGSNNINKNCNIDLITGGFPCQPFSAAGKRKGTADDRYLWPEMFRVIREFKPTWIIAENVKGLTNWSEGMVLEQVCTDLESEGYEVQPFIIPACGVNAPHRRERVWIVANLTSERCNNGSDHRQERYVLHNQNRDAEESKSEGDGRQCGIGEIDANVTNATSEQDRWIQQQQFQPYIESSSDWSRNWREVAFATCNDRVDDGLSKRLVRLPDGSTITHAKWRQEALKAYGNAIVPQVVMEIMKGIANVNK